MSVTFSYSIHHLFTSYIKFGCNVNADDLLLFCSSVMKDDECKKFARLTAYQADDSLWFDFRVGRVSGSKAHEASRCKTGATLPFSQVLLVSRLKLCAYLLR